MLINLAVADFLIAFVVFLNCYYFSDFPMFHPFGIKETIEALDVFTGTSSLICLTMISVERLYAVVFPFKHRMLRLRHYIYILPLPWVISLAVVLLLVGFNFPKSGDNLYTYILIRYSILVFAILIMTIAYFVIWIKRPRNSSSSNIGAYEKRLLVTLFIVTIASMLTWMPLQCFGFAFFVIKHLTHPHVNYFITLKFLQCCNSAINFFIYILRMRDFKIVLLSLLCCKQTVNQPPKGAEVSCSRRSVQDAVSAISLDLITMQGSCDMNKEASNNKSDQCENSIFIVCKITSK